MSILVSTITDLPEGVKLANLYGRVSAYTGLSHEHKPNNVIRSDDEHKLEAAMITDCVERFPEANAIIGVSSVGFGGHSHYSGIEGTAVRLEGPGFGGAGEG